NHCTYHQSLATYNTTPHPSFHHLLSFIFIFFFFNPPPTPEIYTLSLHDALPISHVRGINGYPAVITKVNLSAAVLRFRYVLRRRDRKSTRLNSSHVSISYAVFCLKKKKKKKIEKYKIQQQHMILLLKHHKSLYSLSPQSQFLYILAIHHHLQSCSYST